MRLWKPVIERPRNTHLPPPGHPRGFFSALPGTCRPPDPSAAHVRGRVRSGFARALAHRAHPMDRVGARRWQVKAPIRVPAERGERGRAERPATAYLPTEGATATDHRSKKKNAWLLRYKFTPWGASSRTHARTHAHSQIAREFVGCLSDKLKKVVDRKREICYIVAVFEKECKMYLKDKNQRITLRLTAEQFDFVKTSADSLGVSPSDFLRMVINFTMTTHRKAEEAVEEVCAKTVEKMEGLRRENEQANINNLV